MSLRPIAGVCALLVVVLLTAPSPAGAAEDVGTRGLGSDAVRVAKQYIAKSGNALRRLTDIVKQGKRNSGSAWESACKAVDAPLAAVLANKEIMATLKEWAVDEARAWNCMKSVGKQIAEANEEVLTRLDLVETSNRISKDEIKTATSEVQDMIK